MTKIIMHNLVFCYRNSQENINSILKIFLYGNLIVNKGVIENRLDINKMAFMFIE